MQWKLLHISLFTLAWNFRIIMWEGWKKYIVISKFPSFFKSQNLLRLWTICCPKELNLLLTLVTILLVTLIKSMKILTPQERLSFFIGSRLQMFFKISILKNFAIFTWKHFCWSVFLIKLQARKFPCEYCGIFKNS